MTWKPSAAGNGARFKTASGADLIHRICPGSRYQVYCVQTRLPGVDRDLSPSRIRGAAIAFLHHCPKGAMAGRSTRVSSE